jgi:hypothetical protein
MRRKKKRNRIDAGEFGWSPRYLRREVFAATTALVICLFAGAGLLDRYIKDSGSPYIAAVISAVLVDLANGDRTDAAVDGLRINPKLVAAAQAKANDMAEKGYFAHETPEGYDSWHWFKQVGYDYAYAGENLAVDFSESSDVEKAWMKSPTHRDNILNAHYTEIGIATAKGMYKGRETTFAVQMFGRPSAREVARAIGAPPAAAESVATPDTDASVLGETDVEEVVPVGALGEEDLPRPTSVRVEEGGDPIREPQAASNGASAAIIMTPDQVPWWAYIATQPKQTLRYAYYIIGLLILAALFFDMEIELHWHHMRHAMKAGVMLATMSVLFIAADWLFFAEPILASVGRLMQ